MSLQPSEYTKGRLTAENIGGIEQTTVDFSPGVTILVGRNATNRTSFLQTVMAALGSERVTMKGDADEARVELTLGGETYTRYLRRGSAGLVTEGEPFLNDPTVADLFAFLLESSDARQAVRTGQDLRELIMRPVDTDEIQAEIGQLVQKRETLRHDVTEIEDLKSDLPQLERKRTRLQNEIDTRKQELDATKAELEAADGRVDETRAKKSNLEDKLTELRALRSELDDVRYDIDTERESLQSLKTERQDLKTKRADLPEVPTHKSDEIRADIEQLRQEKQQLETAVNDLQSVIGFNEQLLVDAASGTFAELAEPDTESITDQLLEGDQVSCWTCGSIVEKGQIRTTVDQLQELSQRKVGNVDQINRELNQLQSEQQEIEQTQRELDRIEQRTTAIEREVEETEARIVELQSRREELTGEIESIEAEVDDLESENYGDVLDLHKEANNHEYELGQLEGDLDRVEAEIANIEDRIAEEADLNEQLEDTNTEINSLRTKIERIEREAVEQFNTHMETVLELLEYANLDRIWLERVEQDVRDGREKVAKSGFELHVVRTTDSGVTYEDTIDHLSESEREVTGLVFALAGYLAHEVYNDIPFILLDSLEAIDSGRIAELVEYLTNYTGYLFVALLPEDAAALPDSYERITDI